MRRVRDAVHKRLLGGGSRRQAGLPPDPHETEKDERGKVRSHKKKFSFSALLRRNISSRRNRNIMDQMMEMMVKYANHLEEIVQERTRLLNEEKMKTVDLLHRMLPK